MRSLFVYTFFILTAVLGAAADNTHPSTGVKISSLCANGLEHCPEVVSASTTKATKTVPFGKKARLNSAFRRARGMAHKTSAFQRRQADPSAIPQPERTGIMQIYSGDTSIGYLSATTEDNAIYRVDGALVNAAILTVMAPASETQSSGLRVTVAGSDVSSRFPLLGLVQGRDNINTDIGPGSYHYLYLAGVVLPGTAPGDTPSSIDNSYSDASLIPRAAETDLWDINFTTGVMTPKWINSDGSSPGTVLFTQSGIVYGGGDMAAFATEYSEATGITLRFVF